MTPRVAVVAFDGISPFHLSVPSLVWGQEQPESEIDSWQLTVCTRVPGMLRTSAGYAIEVRHGYEVLDAADIVVIPWWWDPASPTGDDDLSGRLRAAYARGAMVVGLCLGVFAVAESGLLDGRRATTHWKWAETFRNRFPAAILEPEHLYVTEARIVTGAGATAGIDTCLHVLSLARGHEMANRVAKRIVAAPHRKGGQAQFVDAPLPTTTSDAISQVMLWAFEHLSEPISISAMADLAHMSRSTFTRMFRARSGTSPQRWLLSQRLARAQHLLESTGLTVNDVAADSGFASSALLRQHFMEAFNTTPTQYRMAFSFEQESDSIF